MPTRAVLGSVWLPGQDAEDVLQAQHLLLPGGDHLLVERDPDCASRIRRLTAHLPVRVYEGELYSAIPRLPLDYIHVDLNGGLDLNLARWITRLNFAQGADFRITIQYALRHCDFMKACSELFLSNEDLRMLHYLQWTLGQRDDDTISLYESVLRCLLRRYEFTSQQPYPYADTVGMVLFRFNGFKRITGLYQYPDLLHRLGGTQGIEEFRMKNKTPQQRSAIARKAVATRKARELKEKRHNAAVKAWATRRATTQA